MPKDTSLLLAANARPFEIAKVYFFRDRRMRHLIEQTGAVSIERPSLRRWTEPTAWLEANLQSELGTKATHVELGAIPTAPASEGSVVGAPTGNSEAGSVQKKHAAINAEIPDAVAGVIAEAERASSSASSDAGDEIGSALKDLTAITEKIRHSWFIMTRYHQR